MEARTDYRRRSRHRIAKMTHDDAQRLLDDLAVRLKLNGCAGTQELGRASPTTKVGKRASEQRRPTHN